MCSAWSTRCWGAPCAACAGQQGDTQLPLLSKLWMGHPTACNRNTRTRVVDEHLWLELGSTRLLGQTVLGNGHRLRPTAAPLQSSRTESFVPKMCLVELRVRCKRWILFSSPAHIATLTQAHLQPTLNQRRVTVCLTVGELTSDLKSCPSISDKSECSGPIQSIPLPCPALRPTSSAASESGGTDARRTPSPRHPLALTRAMQAC